MTLILTPRQIAILNQVRQEGRVFVDSLADTFVTTPQTIRRDLQSLANAGEVMRFHGGASLPAGVEYTGFDVRSGIAVEEKLAIGRAVAARIPSNTMIMINGGTTTTAVASQLKDHAGLKVLVDNVAIGNDIRKFAGLDVMIPCGTLRRSDGAITGESAIDFIRQFRADIAVVGAAALDESGMLLDFDLAEVHVTRAMIAMAKHVILAVDSSKFGRSAPIAIDELAKVHTLVTDRCTNSVIAGLCERLEIDLVETSKP